MPPNNNMIPKHTFEACLYPSAFDPNVLISIDPKVEVLGENFLPEIDQTIPHDLWLFPYVSNSSPAIAGDTNPVTLPRVFAILIACATYDGQISFRFAFDAGSWNPIKV